MPSHEDFVREYPQAGVGTGEEVEEGGEQQRAFEEAEALRIRKLNPNNWREVQGERKRGLLNRLRAKRFELEKSYMESLPGKESLPENLTRSRLETMWSTQ